MAYFAVISLWFRVRQKLRNVANGVILSSVPHCSSFFISPGLSHLIWRKRQIHEIKSQNELAASSKQKNGYCFSFALEQAKTLWKLSLKEKQNNGCRRKRRLAEFHPWPDAGGPFAKEGLNYLPPGLEQFAEGSLPTRNKNYKKPQGTMWVPWKWGFLFTFAEGSAQGQL